MEEHINGHSEVRTALVAGSQRFQAALLIELATQKALSTAEREDALERIWPIIQEVDQACPAHAMIDKSHILFMHPHKPMLRAGKGTVQRRPTLNLYAEELQVLYDDADKIVVPRSIGIIQEACHHDPERDTIFVRETIIKHTGWKSFGSEDNLFIAHNTRLETRTSHFRHCC